MAKHFIRSSERTITDENGVQRVQTVDKEYVFKSEEDPFYMVFVDFVKWMYNITSVGSLKLLPRLLEEAEFNTGNLSLSPGKRDAIQKELKMSKSTFTRALNDLIDNGAIFRTYIIPVDEETGELLESEKKEAKGEYIVNPEMFWKGALKERRGLKVKFEAILDEQKQSENVISN